MFEGVISPHAYTPFISSFTSFTPYIRSASLRLVREDRQPSNVKSEISGRFWGVYRAWTLYGPIFLGVRSSKKIQKTRGSKVRKDRGSKVKKAAKILRHANLDTIWSKSSENIFATLDQRSFDNFGSASFLHFFVLPFLHLFLF